MITEQVRGYFGFERVPFDRSLAASQLFASATHNEAAARIGYAIATHGLAAITGETGAGKTVAVRAATATLDASRYQVIYLPNPQVGARASTTRSSPPSAACPASTTPPSSPRPPPRWPPSGAGCPCS
jgi:type II secretory pathway predicted ATPase ExeA